MFKALLIRVAALACAALFAKSVPAAVLLDQFDHISPNRIQGTAHDDFTLAGGGTVTGLNLMGIHIDNGFGSGTATVTIRGNEPGIFGSPDTPGSLLYTASLSKTNSPGAVGFYGTSNTASASLFELVFPSSFSYSADTKYWVGVKFEVTAGGFQWSQRSPADTTNVAPNPPANGSPAARESGGEFTSYYKQWLPEDFFNGFPARWGYNNSSFIGEGQYGVDMALQLVGTSSALPEPGSIAMISTVVGGLLLRRRRHQIA